MDKKDIQRSRNYFKLWAKRLLCIVRCIGSCQEDVYISPLSEIKYPWRISLGKGVILERHARLCANLKDSKIIIGNYTTISPYVLLKTNGGKIEIGSFCSVNDYSILYGFAGIKIGDGVHIAAHTTIIASEHNYEKLDTPHFSKEILGSGIAIENSVWIGANVVILDGTTIGTGSVIGAGAVVTKDIPAYSIAVGVPARVLKKRS